MTYLTRLLLGVLLTSGFYLTAQIPAFRSDVLDVNQQPSLRLHFSVRHYYPLDDSAFFFNFDNWDPNPLQFFTGKQLDTVIVDGTVNGRVYNRYAGGFLAYRNDGSSASSRTYHLDPVTYDTVALADTYLQVRHVFPDGRRLLEGSRELYAIGDTPASLISLNAHVAYLSTKRVGLGEHFFFEAYNGTYVTDGTPGGTLRLTEATPSYSHTYVPVDGRVYFKDRDSLHVTDGTPEGTRVLTFGHLPEGQRPAVLAAPFATANGPVFLGRSDARGEYYYYLDPETDQFQPLVATSDWQPVTNDSIAIFRQRSDVGRSILITDGSPAGTRELIYLELEDIEKESWALSKIDALEDGTLYFKTSYTTSPLHWMLPPGGKPRTFVLPEGLSRTYPAFWATRTTLYLTVPDGVSRGVWRHDPATLGFERLTDLKPDFGRMELSDGGILQNVNDGMYDADERCLIYYRGKTKLVNGYRGASAQGARLSLKQVGDTLFGISTEAQVGEAIVSIDLATGKQRVIRDLFPHTRSSEPYRLAGTERAAFFQNEGLFYGSGRGSEYEVLLSDERVSVTDLPGRGFALLRSSGNREWYFSDGSKSGTVKIPSPAIRPTTGLAVLSGDAYYLGYRNIDSKRVRLALIKISGESGESSEVYATEMDAAQLTYRRTIEIVSNGAFLYFTFSTDGDQWNVWRSDGQPEGTGVHTELPDGGNLHPYDLHGGKGFVTYHTRQVEDLDGERRQFLIREGEPTAEIPDYGGWSEGKPVHVAGMTVFFTENGLVGLPDGSITERPLLSCEACSPGQLTVINDTALLYTARSADREVGVYRLNPYTASSTLLVTGLKGNVRDHKPLVRLGELLLIDRSSNSNYYSTNELKLINVLTGESVDAAHNQSVHDLRNIVKAGNRFLYIQDDWIYGKEVFAITFPEISVPKSGTVGTTAEPRNHLAVGLFPNPTAGNVTVDLPIGGEYGYYLLGLRGELLARGTWQGGEQPLRLSGLPAGTYLLRVRDLRSGARSTQRILLQGSR